MVKQLLESATAFKTRLNNKDAQARKIYVTQAEAVLERIKKIREQQSMN